MGLKPDHWIRWMAQDHAMIEPFIDQQVNAGAISYGLSSFGYDMRLDGEFKKLSLDPGRIIDPKHIHEGLFQSVYSSKAMIIPPNSFVLAKSMEYWRIPKNVLGICVGKSTYARAGLIVNITPMEPGWEGFLTIEISNTTPLPVKIYPFEGIAQVMFWEGDAPPEITYADRRGKYQGQTGVQPPKVLG